MEIAAEAVGVPVVDPAGAEPGIGQDAGAVHIQAAALGVRQVEGPGGGDGPVAVAAQLKDAVGIVAPQRAALQGPAGAALAVQAAGVQVAPAARGDGVPIAGLRLLGPAGGLGLARAAEFLALQAQVLPAAGDDEGRDRGLGEGLGGARQHVRSAVAQQLQVLGDQVGRVLAAEIAASLLRHPAPGADKAHALAAVGELRLLHGIGGGGPVLGGQDGPAALVQGAHGQRAGDGGLDGGLRRGLGGLGGALLLLHGRRRVHHRHAVSRAVAQHEHARAGGSHRQQGEGEPDPVLVLHRVSFRVSTDGTAGRARDGVCG